jgi:hypothetical protein
MSNRLEPRSKDFFRTAPLLLSSLGNFGHSPRLSRRAGPRTFRARLRDLAATDNEREVLAVLNTTHGAAWNVEKSVDVPALTKRVTGRNFVRLARPGRSATARKRLARASRCSYKPS